MAFSIGCFACCVPCDPCEAVCSETAVGFEVVYSGNTTDGYLTWSGTANPVNAVPPVTGSYNAQITGNFSLPGDDFPCYARLRVWRNIFTMNPGATETPTSESVVVTCATGKIRAGIFELLAGESVKFGGAAPTSGDGITYWAPASNVMTVLDVEDDQSGGVTTGWNYAIESLCSPSSGGITARVEWTDDDIYHAIYGEFVECFDEQECELDCSGTPTEFGSLFLSITNQTSTMGNNLGVTVTLENDYVLDIRSDPGLALLYCGEFRAYSFSPPVQFFWTAYAIATYFAQGLFLQVNLDGRANVNDNLFVTFGVSEQDVRDLICGSVASLSGTASITLPITNTRGITGTITFDWELST